MTRFLVILDDPDLMAAYHAVVEAPDQPDAFRQVIEAAVADGQERWRREHGTVPVPVTLLASDPSWGMAVALDWREGSGVGDGAKLQPATDLTERLAT